MDLGHDLSQAIVFDAMYAGELSFSRRRSTRDLDGVDLAVVGIPFDAATSNRPGARFGPRAIREQSSLVGCYPWGPWPWDHNVFERHETIDYGDVTFYPGYPERMVGAVVEHVGGLVESGISVLSLGGDHMVAYPLVDVHARRFGPLSLVHFDAHTDTWAMGDDLNHGTVFFLAAREGFVDPGHSIQLGIRTPNPDPLGFEIVDADTLLDTQAEAIAARVRDVVGDRPVYLSFDVDFLDPAYAPGTGTPVVGGPPTHLARRLLRGLEGLDIVGADIVEVSPPYDSGQITALAAATLAHDILYLLAAARAARTT